MEASPVMAVPTFGLLCLGIMAVLFVGLIAGTVILIATADQNARDALWRAGKFIGITAGILVLLGLFFGTSYLAVEHREATLIESQQFDEQQRAFAEQVRQQTERDIAEQMRHMERALPERMATQIESVHGDLSKLPPTNLGNDLRPANAFPADALVALAPSIPPVAPTPASRLPLQGDLRPDWLKEGVTKNGDVTVAVFASPLFATEAEGEASLEDEIKAFVEQDFLSVVRKRSIRPRSLHPIVGDLSSVPTERYVEVEARNLGTVTAPMYRVWKKLELSPQSREHFLVAYRAQVSEVRMLLVGIGCLALLAIPLAIVGSARATQLSHGRGRRYWRWASAGLVLVLWGAAFFWIKRHFLFSE